MIKISSLLETDTFGRLPLLWLVFVRHWARSVAIHKELKEAWLLIWLLLRWLIFRTEKWRLVQLRLALLFSSAGLPEDRPLTLKSRHSDSIGLHLILVELRLKSALQALYDHRRSTEYVVYVSNAHAVLLIRIALTFSHGCCSLKNVGWLHRRRIELSCGST